MILVFPLSVQNTLLKAHFICITPGFVGGGTLPAGVATRVPPPARLIARAPLGVGSPGGAGGCQRGGVAVQLTPCRAGVSTKGNRSHRLRQPVGQPGAWSGRVCSVVAWWAWWRQAARWAPPRMRSRAQAAPLHRACGWCGWCRCGRWQVARWRGHSGPLPVALDRTGAARGGLARWGRWLASWWGRSPAQALPGWVNTRGNRSHRLRQPVGLLGTVWARV